MSSNGDARYFGFNLQDGILPNLQLDPVCPIEFIDEGRSSRQLLLHQLNPKACQLKKSIKRVHFTVGVPLV